MAEIIHRRPAMFSAHIPIVVYLFRVMEPEDLVRFRAGILWGIGRLADIATSDIDAVLPWIASCLDDPDPQVRGMAVWCLAQSRRTEPLQARRDLLSDEGVAVLYLDGSLIHRSVAELTRRALT